jgi:hypothetical protein
MEHPAERVGSGSGDRIGPAVTRHVRWRKKYCPHGNVIETAREQSEDGEHWKTLYRFSMVNPPPCPECERELFPRGR